MTVIRETVNKAELELGPATDARFRAIAKLVLAHKPKSKSPHISASSKRSGAVI